METDTLTFSCLHIQVATFAISYSHTQQTTTQCLPSPPPHLERNEKLKENDFVCYSICLRIPKHYLFCFREILYAFNDDGRRILDNNFLSSPSHSLDRLRIETEKETKRNGDFVNLVYFGRMTRARERAGRAS